MSPELTTVMRRLVPEGTDRRIAPQDSVKHRSALAMGNSTAYAHPVPTVSNY